VNAQQPIGIFDSGIGGLTVANTLLEQLPNENIVYFADYLHFPYGDKSAESIQHYSSRIAEFLLEQNCKCIIIACNSASSAAYETVQAVASDVLVVNVIDPVIYHIQNHLLHLQDIGIIGTRRTIESQAHKKSLEVALPKIKVHDLATPLLAPMIEEGIVDDHISKAIINRYLKDSQLEEIEAIVLACTHYPLIKADVEDFYNNKVNVIDIPSVMAAYIRHLLEKNNLLNSGNEGKDHFYASKWNNTFPETSKLFFNKEFEWEEVDIFSKD